MRSPYSLTQKGRPPSARLGRGQKGTPPLFPKKLPKFNYLKLVTGMSNKPVPDEAAANTAGNNMTTRGHVGRCKSDTYGLWNDANSSDIPIMLSGNQKTPGLAG